MTYHSIHLKFPANMPFDKENWFETFVGRFVKPLLSTGLVHQYWFTRYGLSSEHEVRLRLTTEHYPALEALVQRQIQTFGFIDLHDELSETLEGGLGHGRFLSPDSTNQSPTDRGQLILNFLHSLSALYVDTLVGPDEEGRFRQERNSDVNNPHGSIFESMHHLLCNTTDVVTEVVAFDLPGGDLFIEGALYACQSKSKNLLCARWGNVKESSRHRVRF